MTKSLRKKHLITWCVLTPSIVAGILLAWFSIPEYPGESLIQPETIHALPLVLKKAKNENYEVSVRANTDTSILQLEWINHAVLTHPSATIYSIPENSTVRDSSRQIGRIEARGNWYFPISKTILGNPRAGIQLMLYDFIHDQVIDTIKLNP